MDHRVAFSLHHPIHDALSGAVAVEYRWNSEKDYDTYVLGWPNLTYKAFEWWQLTAGLRTFFTNGHSPGSQNSFETRPSAGLKLLVPNKSNWHMYNYTRYEYRDVMERDTHDHNSTARIRSQFSVEIPLSSREHAWKPGSWYLLASVEPFYRFDKNDWDPVQAGCGIGHVFSSKVRAELAFTAQFARPDVDDGLEYDQGILRLHVKVGLEERLLRRLFNPAVD